MYYSFKVGQKVYLTKEINSVEMLDEVLEGIVTTSEDDYMTVFIKNPTGNFYLMFSYGSVTETDMLQNRYTVYSYAKDAEEDVKKAVNEYRLRQSVERMIKNANMKQLEAVYSYFLSSKERSDI